MTANKIWDAIEDVTKQDPIYWVDSDMMGQSFAGNRDDLVDYCECLQEVLGDGIEVRVGNAPHGHVQPEVTEQQFFHAANDLFQDRYGRDVWEH